MLTWLVVAGVLAAGLGSLVFSTLTYALRDFSRVRLEDHLERRGARRWLEPTTRNLPDLVFVTAFGRLLMNLLILIGVLDLLRGTDLPVYAEYLVGVTVSGAIALFCSVIAPHAIANHAAERCLARFMRPLHALRVGLHPLIRLLHATDRMVGRAAGADQALDSEEIEQEIEDEILSAVEEGAKEGVVDEQERELIESVIEFRDTTVAQAMTARRDIVALPVTAALGSVRGLIEETGHSRIPVYDGTIDHVIGILYARDLLRHLGEPPERFSIRDAIRPAFMVPETKPIRDLLQDFRARKVHIAIVLDEYGGTAGLVTIEDVLEELVGEISDEHEPVEPSLFHRVSETVAEVDARIPIDQLNALMGLSLPEDQTFETLGGFLGAQANAILEQGAVVERDGVRYLVLSAEPTRIGRVRIEMPAPQPQDIAG